MNRPFWFWLVAIILKFVFCFDIAWSHPGWGMVIDKKGQIYFGDVNRNIVWKITLDGNVVKFVSDVHSHDLHIDVDDNVYGEHTWYESAKDKFRTTYWKATPDGKITEIPAYKARSVFRICDAGGNEYRAEGNVHTRESKLLKVKSDGTTLPFVGGDWGYADGKGTQAKLQALGVLRLGPDSALYLTEGGTIRRITLDGTVKTLAGPREGFGDAIDKIQSSSFLGLAIDEFRNVYAANWQKRKVIKVSPDGLVSTVTESGFGWEPSGVACWKGDSYILEHRARVTVLLEKAGFGGPRIRKVARDGTVSTVGTAP